MKVKVYFEGGSRGNPGPAAGAAIVTTEDGELLAAEGNYVGVNTANAAEYAGLLLGLKLVKALGATEIEIKGDSKLVVEQVKGNWRVKNTNLMPFYEQARGELETLTLWSLEHEPRRKNALSDKMVREALQTKSSLKR